METRLIIHSVIVKFDGITVALQVRLEASGIMDTFTGIIN
jgi:hypothetical protein